MSILKPAYSVLFVCTGNICRSPTAHAIMRHYVDIAVLSPAIHVDSAGTHGYHEGASPDNRAAATATRRGYDMAGIHARRLVPEDFERFDLILAMDEGHLAHMRSMARSVQDSRADMKLFLDYNPRAAVREVPDPYYGGDSGFENVCDLIEVTVENLLAEIRQKIA